MFFKLACDVRVVDVFLVLIRTVRAGDRYVGITVCISYAPAEELVCVNVAAESNRFVAFVEEIEYVQGLYPKNSDLIWNAVSMRKTLTQPKSEAIYHTMQEGDTVRSVLLK